MLHSMSFFIFICSNVKDLDSNLKDVDKALFGESMVKDKEHDIGKTKERIKELNRYDLTEFEFIYLYYQLYF